MAVGAAVTTFPTTCRPTPLLRLEVTFGWCDAPGGTRSALEPLAPNAIDISAVVVLVVVVVTVAGDVHPKSL